MRFGIVSLATGLVVYVVAAVARVGEYRNQAQPSWLTSLWLIARPRPVPWFLVV